jgi:DNA-binding transcriptional regulator GbsR (MarR family)
VILAGQKRIVDLQDQRKKLLTEAEFWAKDPTKMPPKLRKDIDENENNIAAQRRFVANQEEEKGRVNKRFDEELARLKVLWAQLRAVPAAAAAAPAPAR